MTSMIHHLYSPHSKGKNLHSWVPEENQDIIIGHPIARNFCWSSGIDTDMFNVPVQLKYIHLQLSCPQRTLRKWNNCIKTIIHSSIHSASIKSSLLLQGQISKRTYRTTKNWNNPCPHFVGYNDVLKWSQSIMSYLKCNDKITRWSISFQTVKFKLIKTKTNKQKSPATMRLVLLCTILHK